MSEQTSTSTTLPISYKHITLYTNDSGEEIVQYLGYTLLLSNAERSIVKVLLMAQPIPLSTAEISKATGSSVGQVSVLVHRINQKAFGIGGRRLILGISHHGLRFNEYM